MAKIEEEIGKTVCWNLCLRTTAVILKIMEVIFLVICISCVGHYLGSQTGDFEGRKTLEFFINASVMACTAVILFILILLLRIQERASVVFCFLAIFMLIASSLLANFDSRDCDDEKNETSRCSELTAGAVFGFFTVITFAADAIIYRFWSNLGDLDMNDGSDES